MLSRIGSLCGIAAFLSLIPTSLPSLLIWAMALVSIVMYATLWNMFDTPPRTKEQIALERYRVEKVVQFLKENRGFITFALISFVRGLGCYSSQPTPQSCSSKS